MRNLYLVIKLLKVLIEELYNFIALAMRHPKPAPP